MRGRRPPEEAPRALQKPYIGRRGCEARRHIEGASCVEGAWPRSAFAAIQLRVRVEMRGPRWRRHGADGAIVHGHPRGP
eukprot:scaffold84380_cov66-Phaeocystis_antarctica.AAC.2